MGTQRVAAEAKRLGSGLVNGHSSIPGAMAWMFGLALIIGLIPVVGPFLGPVVGGVVGGRRAGHPGRAFIAAILPTAALSLMLVAVAAISGRVSHNSVVGGVGALLAGVVAFYLILHNLLLIGAAVVSGLIRFLQEA